MGCGLIAQKYCNAPMCQCAGNNEGKYTTVSLQRNKARIRLLVAYACYSGASRKFRVKREASQEM